MLSKESVPRGWTRVWNTRVGWILAKRTLTAAVSCTFPAELYLTVLSPALRKDIWMVAWHYVRTSLLNPILVLGYCMVIPFYVTLIMMQIPFESLIIHW